MELFQELLRPEYWWDNARRLKYSADVIKEKILNLIHSSDYPYAESGKEIKALLESNLLLLGFAIENAVKGYLVKQYLDRNGEIRFAKFKDFEREVWKVKDLHDLNLLFKLAALELTAEEVAFLQKATKYSAWKGRYHLPRNTDLILNEYREGEGDRHTSRDQILAATIIEKCLVLK